jgi:predicted transcriptional regulator
MSSYIPKQIRPIRERVEAKLDHELIAELEQYCEYLESDRDYVIAQALSVAFRKDKDFA